MNYGAFSECLDLLVANSCKKTCPASIILYQLWLFFCPQYQYQYWDYIVFCCSN